MFAARAIGAQIITAPGEWQSRERKGPYGIDLPEVVAEVGAAFERYEQALVCNDVATLDELFHKDARTIRYGVGESLYGYAQIASFRSARAPVGLMRTRSRTVITTYGRDFAVASTLFHRDAMTGKVGRQMQTGVRFPEGWRVVAAHVSVIADRPRPPPSGTFAGQAPATRRFLDKTSAGTIFLSHPQP